MTKYLSIILVFLTIGIAQDITNKLGGDTANETYDITDSNDTQLFRVEGDGTVLIGTASQNGDLEIDGDEVIRGDLYLRDSFYDKDAEAGTAGQILSSTATATDWIDVPSCGYVLSFGGDIGDKTYYTYARPNSLAESTSYTSSMGNKTKHIVPRSGTITKISWLCDGVGGLVDAIISIQIDEASYPPSFTCSTLYGTVSVNMSIAEGSVIEIMCHPTSTPPSDSIWNIYIE